MAPIGRSPTHNRRILLFLIGIAFAEASMTMPMVQIPVHLRELGANISQIGFFFTISMVFPLLLRIFGGWLADSIGRLRVISIGSFTGVLTFATYALAPSWQAALLAPALLAATTALTFPAYYAYIADHSPEGARGRAYGVAQTVRHVAWVVSPPIGGLIGQAFGYRWMFVASSATFAVAATIFLLLRRTRGGGAVQDRAPGMRSLRASLGEMTALFLAGGLVTWLLIVDGVRDIAFKLSFDLMPVYLNDIAGISKEGIGFLDGIFGLALLITLYPAGVLVDRTSERFAVVLGLLAVISSRLVFALAEGYWGFAASWVLLGLGVGLFDPAGSSLVTKAVPRHLRGLTFGIIATSLSLFSLPSPWIGSQIWTRIGPQYPFLITVVLGSLTIIPAWFKLRVPTKLARPDAPFEATTLPMIGEAAEATILIAAAKPAAGSAADLPTQAELEALLPIASELVEQHGGVVTHVDSQSVIACFGLSPHRSPPQVSALLATHAAMAWRESAAGRNMSAAVERSHSSVCVGIATGQVEARPFDRRHARLPAAPHGSSYTVLGATLEAARLLQGYTEQLAGGGVLISDETYRYLRAAHHQFKFGPSGPVQYPGEDHARPAHQVLARVQRMNPAQVADRGPTDPEGADPRER